MKKKMLFTVAAFVIMAAIAFVFIGCKTDSDNGKYPIRTVRYTTVPYVDPNKAAAGGGGPSYKLVDSLKKNDNSEYYYLFYMGFVKDLPIAQKVPMHYPGFGIMTMSWETNWSAEEAITEAETKSTEHTWEASTSLSSGITVGVKAGFDPPVGSGSVEVSVNATVGASYGGTVSTSTTTERMKSRVEGESFGLSFTLDNAGAEMAGVYRWALFSTTDVYCLVTTTPGRVVKKVEAIHAARPDAAWGIDYSLNGNFIKTGTGEKFDFDIIDLTNLPVPTDIATEAPVVCPGFPTCKCDGKNNCGHNPCFCVKQTHAKGDLMIETGLKTSGGAKTPGSKGNGDFSTGSSSNTKWTLDVKNIRLAGDRGNDQGYQYVDMDFVFHVEENKSDWTEVTQTVSHRHDLGNRRVTELTSPTSGTRTGYLKGKNNSVEYLGSWSDGAIRWLEGQLDGSGDDDKNVKFNADIFITFQERID